MSVRWKGTDGISPELVIRTIKVCDGDGSQALLQLGF